MRANCSGPRTAKGNRGSSRRIIPGGQPQAVRSSVWLAPNLAGLLDLAQEPARGAGFALSAPRSPGFVDT